MTDTRDPAKVEAAYKGILGQFVTSPTKVLIAEDYKKWAWNLLKYTAPIMGVFFYQLSQGVDWKLSGLVALYALYGLLSDLSYKWAASDTYRSTDPEVPTLPKQ